MAEPADAPFLPDPTDLNACLRSIETRFSELGPELQRCARWVSDHPREVGLLSMRKQAELAGATPTSMVRLARALGFADYGSLRKPFQDALSTPAPTLRDKVQSMQAGTAARPGGDFDRDLDDISQANVHSAAGLNSPAALATAADAILGAKRVAFLGVRSCFAISFHFHYTYGLVAANGLLVHGLGGAFPDQADALAPGDLVVCITQQPYGRQTIDTLRSCHARGVSVLTLTDSPVSPAVQYSSHTLLFQTASPSFFHSMLGPLALVERLLAHLAARGGAPMLDRLAQVESRLQESQAYWSSPPHRKKTKR